MKNTILLFLALAAAAPLQAATRSLVCTSGSDFEAFHATLDDSHFDAGSGLFRVKDASIQDNYATAPLICVGYRLHEITCTGFWLESRNEIVEVKVRKSGSKLVSSYRPLVGQYQLSPQPWACEVEESDAQPGQPGR